MSFDALNWAIEAAVPDAGCRLVLILLANRANGSRETWPSLNRLAREAVLDKATVCRKLAVLEELGLISRTQQRAGNRSNEPTRYTLQIPPPLVAQCDKGSRTLRQALVAQCDRNPNLEPTPLPPGWAPNRDDVADVQRRFPAMTPEQVHASTEKFVSHFTETGKRHRDWSARWRAWVSEDGSDPRRTKRTATRTARSERLGDRNRRSASEALARL